MGAPAVSRRRHRRLVGGRSFRGAERSLPALAARSLFRAAGSSQLQPVRFERVKLPLYRQWLDRPPRRPLPQKINTVMIVGFPPNWLRYPHLAAHWALTQLDVEVALIEVLGRAGFKVLYKAHPEFERETRELVQGPGLHLRGRPSRETVGNWPTPSFSRAFPPPVLASRCAPTARWCCWTSTARTGVEGRLRLAGAPLPHGAGARR